MALRLFILLLVTTRFCFSQNYYQLLNKAESENRIGNYNSSINLYISANRLSPLLSEDLYNLSCIYGKINDTTKALEYLKKAINKGFGNSDYILQEPSFNLLHGKPEFETLLNQAAQNDSIIQSKITALETKNYYSINKVFTPSELAKDISILKTIMEEVHPGNTWYSTQAEIDSAYSQLENMIQSPQNVLAFFKDIKSFMVIYKDVHLDVKFPSYLTDQLNTQNVFFPIQIKFINHKCYIISKNLFNSQLSVGDEIISINNHPIEEIEKNLATLIPADGYSETGKTRIVSRLFYKLYHIAYNQNNTANLRYKNADGQIKETNIALVNKDRIEKTSVNKYQELNDSLPVRYYILKNIPVLKINTFNNSNFYSNRINYFTFLDSVFKDLQIKESKNLILDIRQNNGGDELLLQELLSYLINKEYKPYASASVKTTQFKYLSYTDDSISHISERIKIEFQPDSNGCFVRASNWANSSSVKKTIFKGKVIVLINGLNVSAGSSFASLLFQNRNNTLFVGEETGGGFYGNISSYYFNVTLPNTKLQCRIPLVQLKLNVNGMPFGRGLQPQYLIQDSFQDLLLGNDPVLNKAIELIQK